jgi:hypothetical protein
MPVDVFFVKQRSKKKNRPEVIRTVSSNFGDFCFRTSFRTSSGVTAQGTVASPARLPQPFQVAPDD